MVTPASSAAQDGEGPASVLGFEDPAVGAATFARFRRLDGRLTTGRQLVCAAAAAGVSVTGVCSDVAMGGVGNFVTSAAGVAAAI